MTEIINHEWKNSLTIRNRYLMGLLGRYFFLGGGSQRTFFSVNNPVHLLVAIFLY